MTKIIRKGQVFKPSDLYRVYHGQRKKKGSRRHINLFLTEEGARALVELKAAHPELTASQIVSSALCAAASADKGGSGKKPSDDEVRRIADKHLDEVAADEASVEDMRRKLAEDDRKRAEQSEADRAEKEDAARQAAERDMAAQEEAVAEASGRANGQDASSTEQAAEQTIADIIEKRRKGKLRGNELERYKEHIFLYLYSLQREGKKLTEVARALNEKGYPPIEGEDGKWDETMVSRWMTQEVLPRKTRWELKLQEGVEF